MSAPVPPGGTLVVGVAVLRDQTVLAALRSPGSATTDGRWELPGGKVEPGEDPAAAAEREIAEELGCRVRVTGWLPGTVPVRPDLHLAVATAVLVGGEPVPHEHDAVRWVDAGALEGLEWAPADVAFLPAVRALLTGSVPRGS